MTFVIVCKYSKCVATWDEQLCLGQIDNWVISVGKFFRNFFSEIFWVRGRKYNSMEPSSKNQHHWGRSYCSPVMVTTEYLPHWSIIFENESCQKHFRLKNILSAKYPFFHIPSYNSSCHFGAIKICRKYFNTPIT